MNKLKKQKQKQMNTENKKETQLQFRSHVRNLFDEILSNMTRDTMAVKIPLKVTYGILQSVAQRASQLNDPILNELMMRLAMYDVTDPSSKNYDQKVVEEISRKANEYRNAQKSKS